MRYQIISALAIMAVLSTATPTTAQAPVTKVTARTQADVSIQPKVSNALRALQVLRSYGYTWTTDAGALKAIKHWQRVNSLTVDGEVGAETLASLHLPATAAATAVRLTPPASVSQPGSGDVETIIRDVWPDELEDRAVAIATRESNLQPAVINRNRDATGLFQIMWSVHRRWLCPELDVCSQSQLQDAGTNAHAAYALYQRAGGWGPWAM